mgnify:CR=1 FL=1
MHTVRGDSDHSRFDRARAELLHFRLTQTISRSAQDAPQCTAHRPLLHEVRRADNQRGAGFKRSLIPQLQALQTGQFSTYEAAHSQRAIHLGRLRRRVR